jgi:pimeloyl-ACP methyl ester carboxylesterase
MAEQKVAFDSDGLRLAGVLGVPDGLKAGERRPALMFLHGFGSTKDAGGCVETCRMLTGLGYVTLRFDMRGCGESEGEPGRIICLEQVADTRHAVTFLAGLPEVDAQRIGCMGASFGAAVTVYAAGVDARIACAVSAGGWGDGASKFRRQHAKPEDWARFEAMLAKGQSHRERTGRSLMVPRYDIVLIPEHLRHHVVPGSVQMFPAETAQSMYDFRANDVVGQIAPRPLLLLHPAQDSVTPTEQSIGLFMHAGQPTELHLFAETDHFLLGEKNVSAQLVLSDWLARYFPV